MMFCPRCGDQIEQNEMYCNKCGNYLGSIGFNYQNDDVKYNDTSKKNNNKKMIFIGIGLGFGILFLIFIMIFSGDNSYYFSNNDYDDDMIQNQNTDTDISSNVTTNNNRGSKYSTVVVTDNTYFGVQINEKQDAYDLIVKDSISQKSSCSNAINSIENEIIEKYNITAVNLCEMDVEFAKELLNVFKVIYEEYPGARGYLTNLSLINAPMSQGYIAAFMPIFNFAKSDSISGYPWIIKTQVLLNTTYFLNPVKLESSVIDGSNSGHFPPNATIYSPVAHELGHYLSFLAMMNYYNVESILLIDSNNDDDLYNLYDDFVKGDFSLLMIKEAYEKCKKDTNLNIQFDEWRATISAYAVSKDNNGDYIYDETIAEAFHDVYLNGDNAKEASKYVVGVLKKKLEG